MNTQMPSNNRVRDLSPNSTGADTTSSWSGMNGYSSAIMRSEGPYAAAMPFPRSSSTTPEGQPRMNGIPSNPALGPPPPTGQRRRPSEAGSQFSSRAGSVANSNSRSSDGTLSDPHSRRYRKMEAELQHHYTVLRAYLRGNSQQPPRANKARDKLLRLSSVQFHELSTDVFDELQRRQAAAPLPGREPRQINVPPFLQPIPQFHEKRNQARQKLSSLQTPRFRDLSTDVFCELERRFPYFLNPEARRRDSSRSTASRAGSGRPPLPQVNTNNGSMSQISLFPPRSGSIPGNVPQSDNTPGSASSTGSEYGRPTPKQFQSNTITPNKSTMVEDDEDEDDTASSNYGRGNSSDAFGLDSAIASPVSDRGRPIAAGMHTNMEVKALHKKVSSLESIVQQKDNQTIILKKELDKKLEDAEQLNKSLKTELDKLRTENANMERDLQMQAQAAQKAQENNLWRDKHSQLEQENQNLQSRLEDQRKVTDEVSRQGERYLTEMRAMAESSGGSFEREEKLQSEVHKLEEEVKEWKARYAKAKTQVRNARATSTSIMIKGPDTNRYARDDNFRSANGIIKDMHVSQFQIAIDELLQTARSSDPTTILGKMREVVMAVRDITIDVDATNSTNKPGEFTQQVTRMKDRVSATANNVITATKNYAAADGLSPVSLLDAAASHLTAAVVDLIRLVKVCPMPTEDSLDEDGFIQIPSASEPVNDAGYFNMNQRLRKASTAGSEYSALSSPPHGLSGPGPATSTPTTLYSTPNHIGNGLGIHSGSNVGEDDTELQELKIYLENQTDLLVHTIQALVTSIRTEDEIPTIQAHVSAIVDIVENVLSAAEGAMEDPSSYQAELKEKAAAVVQTLTIGKDKLLQAGNDPKANVVGPSAKTFTQRLPPLAFQIARETKDLVSRIESVEAGKADDFS